MNRIFLILVLFISSNSFSQSLRDSLFSGKLKADSALVAKSKVNEQRVREDSVRRVQIDSLKKIGADTTQLTVNPSLAAKPELKYSDNNKTWKKFVDEIYRTIVSDKESFQQQYDEETDHSRNKSKQEDWLKKIGKELDETRDWAGY